MRLYPLALLVGPLACATSAPGTPPATSASASSAQPPVTATQDSTPVIESAPVVIAPRRPTPPAPEYGAYRARVTDAYGNNLQTFFHNGRSFVLGANGERYRIHLSNPTARRVEAVVSVDGLDAVDGESADYVRKRGYILGPYAEVDIEGFRTSMSQVATFRFASVADSYAAKKGDARNVGVIGVAFFPERYVPPPPPVYVPDAQYRRPTMPTKDYDDRSPAPAAKASPSQAPHGAESAQGSGRAQAYDKPAEERRGLGTEFGEARQSYVSTTSFERANAYAPAQVMSVRYNDRRGLEAIGIVFPTYGNPWDDENRVRESAQPFPQTVRFAQPPPR